MPVIRIPDLLLKRLEAISDEGDTALCVINRLLGEYETHYNIQPFRHENCITLDPDSPKDLNCTRVMRAIVGEREIYVPNWNKIVDAIHEIAISQQMSVERLIDLTLSHVVEGEKRDSGFHYLPKSNISIQGVGTTLAWRNTLHLAKFLQLPLFVIFKWRDKQGAAHPGKFGQLLYSPKIQ